LSSPAEGFNQQKTSRTILVIALTCRGAGLARMLRTPSDADLAASWKPQDLDPLAGIKVLLLPVS
jgi:hypothetical protein